jgi:hypothetical protein
MKNTVKRWLCVTGLWCGLGSLYSGCSSTYNAEESVSNEHTTLLELVSGFNHDKVDNDKEYAPVLKKWTRDVTLYKNFDMTLSSSAVLISSEMKKNYEKKYEKWNKNKINLDENVIAKKENVLSVVVILFSSFKNMNDLTDNDVWTKTIHYKNQWISASDVIEYKNKTMLEPYFHVGSHWSKVFVVQFPVPDLDKTWEKLGTAEAPLEFSLHSGIANADFYWR